jgi:CRP-like cAMP-binding protein
LAIDLRVVHALPVVPPANTLLTTLPAPVRDRLRPYWALVSLAKGRVVCDAGEPIRSIYFPVAGMISILGITEAGQSLEVSTVGHDGFTGVALALDASTSPHRLVVQIPGSAHRIPADVIRRELRRHEEFEAAAQRCARALVGDLTQSAICLTFHTLPQRLARWLLVSRDRLQSNTIALTQESVSQMLGASRPRVSHVLMELEVRALIHQGLRRIHIVDVRGLERASCECYRLRKGGAGTSSQRTSLP